MTTVRTILVAGCLPTACALRCLAQATFMGLGPGSEANAISADGTTVVGDATLTSPTCDDVRGAARWTAEEGWTRLEIGCTGWANSEATGVSADGRFIAGYELDRFSGYSYFWADGEVTFLPDPKGCAAVTGGLSADGATLAAAWRDCAWYFVGAWTRDLGSIVFTGNEGEAISGLSWAAANDGSVVGEGAGSDGIGPFRWTRTGGIQWLDLLLGDSYGVALGVSPDGDYIVGSSDDSFSSGAQQAVRWTRDGRVQDLQFVGGGRGVSADGNTVVGGSNGAAVWNARDGKRWIVDVLEEYGVSTEGWELIYAAGVTADGRTVVGYGRDADGRDQAWLAMLPAFCHPDCNADGGLNINDFLCFQSRWRAQDIYGDFNNDAKFNINDYIAFQAEWRRVREGGGCE